MTPGHEGYSAALGNIVLLLDHLRVGESTRLPQQADATPHGWAQGPA